MQEMPQLGWFNALAPKAAREELLKCCGSKRWAVAIEQGRPYLSLWHLIAQANDVWRTLDQDDWLEAFRSHPKIGEKKAANPVAAQSQQWSAQEQRGVADATQET